MNTAKELRDNLSQVFRDLRDGKIKAKDASELANIAGKMIASAKVQVEYCALRQEKPLIAFLKDEKDWVKP